MNATYKLSRYHVATGPIADQVRGGRVQRILFGMRKGATLLVGEDVWARLQDGALDGLPKATLDQLVQAELLVPAEEDEVALSRAVAEELVNRLHVRKIEITLDGTAEHHDRRRFTKAGAGTFERIFENLVAIARREDLSVGLNVRCNVDQHNRHGVLPLLQRLAEAGVQRRITAFYVSPVVNWGNDAGDRNVARDEFARWEIEWFVEMFKLGFPVGVLPERQAANCMALAPEAELVDPHGTLFNIRERLLLAYAMGRISALHPTPERVR